MLNETLEFFRAVFDIKLFAVLTVIGLGGVAYSLVRFMTESLLLASLYTPFIMLGGLISHHLFRHNSIMLTPDKDSNIVLTVAVGLIATLIVLIAVTRLINMLAEWRVVSREGDNSLIAARSR